MRKLLLAALAAAMVCTAARAETVDLATVKCSDLANLAEQESTFMFTWLLGYLGGQAGSTTLDLDAMESAGTKIGQYCAANPDVGLLSAAQEVMSE
jgi:acid stress chaperone HdeB